MLEKVHVLQRSIIVPTKTYVWMLMQMHTRKWLSVGRYILHAQRLQPLQRMHSGTHTCIRIVVYF